MRSQIFSFTKLLILSVSLLAGPALILPARADPAIIDYVCVPALPKGDHMTIDWNAGRNVIVVQFPPNQQTARLSFVASEFDFRYQKGKTEVFGKGDKDVSLQIGKDPLRTCTRQGAFREQHSPEQHSPETKRDSPENADTR